MDEVGSSVCGCAWTALLKEEILETWGQSVLLWFRKKWCQGKTVAPKAGNAHTLVCAPSPFLIQVSPAAFSPLQFLELSPHCSSWNCNRSYLA